MELVTVIYNMIYNIKGGRRDGKDGTYFKSRASQTVE